MQPGFGIKYVLMSPQVPRRPGRVSAAAALLCLLLALIPAQAAKPGLPTQTIPLEPLGFDPVPSRLLLNGDAMFTLNFVDDQHLLFTFTTRGLIKRRADAEANDQDRNVAAVLLELPSGKVLARTEWHLRDHRPYLWSLGRGHFLLRVRDTLTIISPLANLAEGKAFEEQSFLNAKRRIAHIAVSPVGDLLTLETEPLSISVKEPGSPGAALATQRLTPIEDPGTPTIQINFFRINESGEGKSAKVNLQAAGVVRARDLVEIPASSEGFLDVSQESSGVYLFDFQEHGGKRLQLSPYDTTCIPRARFISPSEFVAFGCTGSADRQQIAGFNLKGEENWIAAFPNRHVFPYLLASPASGRFALSRTIVSGTYLDLDNLTPEQISAQEITVQQGYDGRQLLKVQAGPVQRAEGNFDLSPSGLDFAIVHAGKLDLYRLPPLTRQDEAEIKAARAYAPAVNTATITLGAKPKSGNVKNVPGPANANITPDPEGTRVGAETVQAADRVDETVATSPTAGQTSADAAGSNAAAAASGDIVGDVPRKPPTLYDKDHPKQPQ